MAGSSLSRLPTPRRQGYLKIGDVARLIGVSPSLLRTWESLGIVRPPRTHSRYRLYTPDDVRVLKRARFLRRVRGLNAPAILQALKREGLWHTRRAPAASVGTPGARLRSLRLKRGLPLAAVAAPTGVSVGFLSALERGHMTASVGTLRKLARFYNINILDFFNPTSANPRRVRPSERKALEAGPGVTMELLAWGNTVMEPHLFRISPGAASGGAYTHDGEEFLYILQGKLAVSLDGGEEVRLDRGDSFYFESSTPHRWSNPGKQETLVLWVNTPPTF